MSDPIIEPTPGRIVWYYKDSFKAEPLAAIVTKVYGTRLVNLAVFHEEGYPMPKQEVQLVQSDDLPPSSYGEYCTWMPYQVAQAKKHT